MLQKEKYQIKCLKISRRSERKENIWNELFVCSNRTVFEINALNKGHCTPDIVKVAHVSSHLLMHSHNLQMH